MTLATLASIVQRNCNLADARHAGDLSLCTYLLEMREQYRWERALPLAAAPDRAAVGAWIAEREARWEALAGDADASFAPLPIRDETVDAFDAERANAALVPRGLVYGAGVERFGRPGFFLAGLASDERRDGARVLVTDAEYARGLNPPPAASRGDLVLVRRDVLRRWLWTKMETASRRTTGDAFVAALDAYAAGDTEATLERMAQAETETLVLHELGERAAARTLGPDWEAMLEALDDRRTELVVRAVRDLIADCAVTLPQLLARDARASIHFWFSTFDGLRRELAPELRASYQALRAGDGSPLRDAIGNVESRLRAQALELLACWRSAGVEGVVAFATALAPSR
jgi:hypothetical protein